MTKMWGHCPLSACGEREKKSGVARAIAPKTKRGPAFPPAPRCRRPLACPSGRRARRGGGRRCSTNRQGMWNPAFQRSRCVRWPVTGTGPAPKSRVPASMSLRSLPALRRSGIAVRSSIDTIPEGASRSITSRRSFCPKAQVPSRLWLHLPDGPKGTVAPLQPAPPGPKTGFASMASGPARCPKASAPALLPVIPGARPGMPLDACPFRSRKADANIVPAVSRGGVPVPIHAVSRRHLHGSVRDKHMISL